MRKGLIMHKVISLEPSRFEVTRQSGELKSQKTSPSVERWDTGPVFTFNRTWEEEAATIKVDKKKPDKILMNS